MEKMLFEFSKSALENLGDVAIKSIKAHMEVYKDSEKVSAAKFMVQMIYNVALQEVRLREKKRLEERSKAADIYKLDLHEKMWDDESDMEILRVPGGWLYRGYSDKKEGVRGTFVPFHNEFQPTL